MFWFIVLLLVVGAGFYFYQKMKSIEREIYAEQKIAPVSDPVAQDAEKPPLDVPQATVFDTETKLSAVVPEESETATLEASILAEVAKQPGLKQTDLYPLFAATNKKQLQRLLKEMADEGRLKREKESRTFLLYPI